MSENSRRAERSRDTRLRDCWKQDSVTTFYLYPRVSPFSRLHKRQVLLFYLQRRFRFRRTTQIDVGDYSLSTRSQHDIGVTDIPFERRSAVGRSVTETSGSGVPWVSHPPYCPCTSSSTNDIRLIISGNRDWVLTGHRPIITQSNVHSIL